MTKHWPSDRLINDKNDKYPEFICVPCAIENGGRWPAGHLASMSTGLCGWCGKQKEVTEPRDWGYPSYKLKKVRDS